MNLNNWKIQLRKGLLELAVLNLLSNGRQHGYEMVQTLKRIDGLIIRHGNLYPILARLQIDGLVKCVTEPSDEGPERKYFELTKAGEKILEQMDKHWDVINESILRIRKGKYQ